MVSLLMRRWVYDQFGNFLDSLESRSRIFVSSSTGSGTIFHVPLKRCHSFRRSSGVSWGDVAEYLAELWFPYEPLTHSYYWVLHNTVTDEPPHPSRPG